MPIQQLLSIIQDIAAGKYSNDIMALTGEDTPDYSSNAMVLSAIYRFGNQGKP